MINHLYFNQRKVASHTIIGFFSSFYVKSKKKEEKKHKRGKINDLKGSTSILVMHLKFGIHMKGGQLMGKT